MKLFNEDYTDISVKNLASGMNINFSIYYLWRGEYVLLCKNTVLTDELIGKFIKLTEPTYRIYIPTRRYETMFMPRIKAESPPVAEEDKSSDSVAHFPGYVDVKSRTESLLEETSKNEIVPLEITSAISDAVKTQIETLDASVIVQSINTLRKVDEYLHTHSVNVALINGLIGKWLKFDKEALDVLIKIGLLHDIGKLSIPPEILNKPAKLTREEFQIMKQHPVHSCNILARSGVTDKRILLGALQHHERVNGSGYPHGVLINEIGEFARITAISDVYDAMVAKRAYKDAHTPFEILAWFSKGAFSDLDITFVNIFMDCMIEELKGKQVLLSDGRTAEVLYVHSSNFEFPIVKSGDTVINTSPQLHCVSMINYLSDK